MEKGGGHYPHQAPIDAYGDGGFRFAGMSHRGSLLCLPSGMHAWPVSAFDDVNEASLERVLKAATDLDVVLLGLGLDIAFVPQPLRALFQTRSCVLEAVSTGSAVRTYNILLAEQRAVGAALIAVDNPFAR